MFCCLRLWTSEDHACGVGGECGPVRARCVLEVAGVGQPGPDRVSRITCCLSHQLHSHSSSRPHLVYIKLEPFNKPSCHCSEQFNFFTDS